MNNLLVIVIASLLVIGIVIGLNFSSIQQFYVFVLPLNQISNIEFSDIHNAKNRFGHFSTLGNIEIINENTIKVIFDNSNKYGYYNKEGVKYWSIPTQFELVKDISIGDKFITHCYEVENAIALQILELVEIQNDDITFNHYSAALPKGTNCKYPEIIEYSFDIKWNN